MQKAEIASLAQTLAQTIIMGPTLPDGCSRRAHAAVDRVSCLDTSAGRRSWHARRALLLEIDIAHDDPAYVQHRDGHGLLSYLRSGAQRAKHRRGAIA